MQKLSPRQYTQDGGYRREPTTWERARDIAANTAYMAGQLVVAPKPSRTQRADMLRATGRYYDAHDIDNHPSSRLFNRTHKKRVVTATVAALALTLMLTHSKGNTAGAGIDNPAPTPTPEGTVPAVSLFTQGETRALTTAYAAANRYWDEKYPHQKEPTLVLVDGAATPNYSCPDGEFTTPQDTSYFCRGNDAIVVTPSSYGDWVSVMGTTDAASNIINHEYGHHVQQVRGERETFDDTVAYERQANCFAGAATEVSNPHGVYTIVRDIGVYGSSDGLHGSAQGMADAFSRGMNGRSCNSLASFAPGA